MNLSSPPEAKIFVVNFLVSKPFCRVFTPQSQSASLMPDIARLSHDRSNKLPLHLRPQQTAYTNWRASLRWESRTRILATLSFEAKSTAWRLQLWRQRSAPRPLAVGQLVLSSRDNPGAKSYRSCEKRTRVSGSLTRGGCVSRLPRACKVTVVCAGLSSQARDSIARFNPYFQTPLPSRLAR